VVQEDPLARSVGVQKAALEPRLSSARENGSLQKGRDGARPRTRAEARPAGPGGFPGPRAYTARLRTYRSVRSPFQ